AVAIKARVCPQGEGAASVTDYHTLESFERDGRMFSLLQVTPRSGRKHQIRIHMAHVGHPLVGEKLYGEDEQIYLAFVERRLTEAQQTGLILPYQALHAGWTGFVWAGRERVFESRPEAWFLDFMRPNGMTGAGRPTAGPMDQFPIRENSGCREGSDPA